MAEAENAPATIRHEIDGRVAIITYDNQAKRNAWNLAMYHEIVSAIESANADDAIGAIVITHEGPVFCAGTDLKAPAEPRDPETGVRPNIATVSMQQDESWLHLIARSKPVVGAIRGKALGLGVTQLLPLDIRIGGSESSYAFPFLRLGYMPELGCTALLPRLVGYGRAMQLCLTAATLDAEEAHRIGLLSELQSDAEVLPRALSLAKEIAEFPALQTRLTKELFAANALETDINAILRRETDAFVEMLRTKQAAKAGAGPS